MTRVFSPEFQKTFGGQLRDDDLRFRSPPGATRIQCRLGKETIQGQSKKGESYPVIEITKDAANHVLVCPIIGEKGECPSGGWCAQLGYPDVIVTKT